MPILHGASTYSIPTVLYFQLIGRSCRLGENDTNKQKKRKRNCLYRYIIIHINMIHQRFTETIITYYYKITKLHNAAAPIVKRQSDTNNITIIFTIRYNIILLLMCQIQICVHAYEEKFVKSASRRRAAAGASKLHYYYLATTSEFYVYSSRYISYYYRVDQLRNKSIRSLYYV